MLPRMAHVDVSHLRYTLPNSRVLLDDVSFRVGEGAKAALVGANGTGKTTLLRILSGELKAGDGTAVSSGGLGVMPQFIGSVDDGSDVRALLLSVAPAPIRDAAAAMDRAELAMMEHDDEPRQLAYADALARWTDVGGYDAEHGWDECCDAALGQHYEQVRYRDVATLSGGEQKRLVLEALLRGPDGMLLLDEPDNYLDVPGKLWLERVLRETTKTVLYISHDRELLARTATRIVTLEGGLAWTHGGGFATYDEARRARHERLDAVLRQWEREHQRLKDLVRTLQQQAARSPDMASRYRAAQTRLRKFEEAGPPEAPPPEQKVTVRLGGGRTGDKVVICNDLALTGLTKSFDLEIYYGQRVAVLGRNGTGKSHLLRLLGGDTARPDVAHTGRWRLGARVVAGHFSQTHDHPELVGRTLVDILWEDTALRRGPAMAVLRRYELEGAGDAPFELLSGGQQARFQILLLELSGTTLLLLDEPTDNLDVVSAEALEHGLERFVGTVIAVTHDRWFVRGFDRFVVLDDDGVVREVDAPTWET
ncbi:ATP-binding cassette domain-containing protein [soil metagenome]